MKPIIVIGLDIGVNTGLSVYDTRTRKLNSVNTMKIHTAMKMILLNKQLYGDDMLVRFENVKGWRPFKGKTRKESDSKLSGAGSIKRDQGIWEDFLADNQIEYQLVGLTQVRKKLTPEELKQFTGWEAVTSEHGRDSAMLCYGY